MWCFLASQIQAHARFGKLKMSSTFVWHLWCLNLSAGAFKALKAIETSEQGPLQDLQGCPLHQKSTTHLSHPIPSRPA